MEAVTKLLNSSIAHALSYCIHLVAKLNIADVMGKAERHLSCHEIVEKLPDTVNVEYLQRILRFLCSEGISDESVAEGEDSPRFGLNAVSQLLRTDIQNTPSFRNLVMGCMALPQRNAWDKLDSCVISEERNKIDFVEGNGMDFFSYYAQKEEFNDAMVELSQPEVDATLTFYAEGWSELNEREASVLDVGGGYGHVMKAIKKRFSRLHCIVLDLPEVLSGIGEKSEGIDYKIGDFFKPETLLEVDAIYMKHILHNWSDEKSMQILNSCGEALKRGGKLVIGEAVLPSAGQFVKSVSPSPFIMDVSMMVGFGGKERTSEEWMKLLSATGFRINKIIETPVATCQIIEAIKL